MATTTQVPVPSPLVTLEQEALQKLHDGLHKIIFAHMGVFVLFIALIAAGGYFGLRSYDKQVERADALALQFQKSQELAAASQKQLADIIAADTVARAQETARQQDIEQQMLKRNTQAPAPVVVEALKPSANAANVVLAIQSQHANDNPPVDPKVLSDGNLSISVPEAQRWVSEKADLDRFSANYRDEVQLYTLEQSKTTSLSKDLAQCQDTETKDQAALTDAKKTIAAYDKAAHKSKFRKILGSIGRNAERVGLIVAGIELGQLIKR